MYQYSLKIHGLFQDKNMENGLFGEKINDTQMVTCSTQQPNKYFSKTSTQYTIKIVNYVLGFQKKLADITVFLFCGDIK